MRKYKDIIRSVRLSKVESVLNKSATNKKLNEQ